MCKEINTTMVKKRIKRGCVSSLFDFSSWENKKAQIGLNIYLFVLFFAVLVGLGSVLYFWEGGFGLTGFSTVKKDSTLTLSVNSYVNADSVIIFKTETQEIEKKVSELNLELANGSYYVDTLSFDITEIGLDLEKEDIITASLIDNGNTIAESELTYSKEKEKDEIVEENTTEETIATPELNETEESTSNETQEDMPVQNETQEVIQIPEANETELPIEQEPKREENKAEVQIPELNETIPILNKTTEQNLTIINETVSNITLQNVTTKEANKSEQTIQ